jgi:hypothetical protein
MLMSAAIAAAILLGAFMLTGAAVFIADTIFQLKRGQL